MRGPVPLGTDARCGWIRAVGGPGSGSGVDARLDELVAAVGRQADLARDGARAGLAEPVDLGAVRLDLLLLVLVELAGRRDGHADRVLDAVLRVGHHELAGARRERDVRQTVVGQEDHDGVAVLEAHVRDAAEDVRQAVLRVVEHAEHVGEPLAVGGELAGEPLVRRREAGHLTVEVADGGVAVGDVVAQTHDGGVAVGQVGPEVADGGVAVGDVALQDADVVAELGDQVLLGVEHGFAPSRSGR